MKTHKSKYRALEQQPFAVLNQVQLDVRNQLNEQIRNNNLQYEDVPCLCGNNDYDVICTIETYGLDQQTVICRYCGLSRSNPRLTETEYRHFYVSDVYRLLYCANINEDIKARFDAPDKHYNDSKNILERVRKFKQIDGSTSILEFGSGAGYNLWSFFKAGANCTGIDYSKKSVEIGKEYGLNILQGGLEKIEGQFDVILLCHNLEHLLDPIAALKQIKSHLTTDGLVYISVPNIEHLSLAQIQIAHTYYFVPDNFKYYVECAGLKNIDLGASQVMHMYGIFKVEDIVLDTNNLLLSKKKMYRVLNHIERIGRLKWFLKEMRLLNVLRFVRRQLM